MKSMKWDRVRFTRVFALVFIFAGAGISSLSGVAEAEEFSDVFKRMDKSGQIAMNYSQNKLLEAKHEAFFGVDGYRARVLRGFCNNVYGDRFKGEFPPVIRAGFTVSHPWHTQNESLAASCTDPSLVKDMLNWFSIEADWQIKPFLVRAAKLINIKSGKRERVYVSDANEPTTFNLDFAVSQDMKFEQILGALKADTLAYAKAVFGNPSGIYRLVKESLQDFYPGALPREDDLKAAERRAGFLY